MLTDVVMPGVSGRDVAERAAGLRPTLPVLFMSGYTAGLIGPDATVAESVDLLEKPFTQSALLCRVAEAFCRRSASQSP